MEIFLLYLWLKINSFIEFFQCYSVILVFVVIGYCTINGIVNDTNFIDSLKRCKLATAGAVMFGILGVILPTKGDIAILVAGNYAIDIAKSPEAGKLMTVIRGKANEMLDEQIKQLDKKQ